MTDYVVTANTGTVHRADCKVGPGPVRGVRYDPAKAHLVPGLTAHHYCLPDGVPVADREEEA